MNAYDVFVDPSVISNTLSCFFISARKKHLIVGKATILEIYEVTTVDQPSSSRKLDYKLKLIDSYKLQGLIRSLKSVRTTENIDLDYVLVLTDSAKVSCIKWDAAKHSIVTVSLHYYENVLQNVAYERLHQTDLIVSSPSRPLCCLRRNNLLVFLPFNGHDDDGEGEEGLGENEIDEVNRDGERNSCLDAISHNSSILKADILMKEASSASIADSIGIKFVPSLPQICQTSMIIDANMFDETIGEIIDLQFLHNYRVTTVGVISQVKKTCAGLLPREADNVIFSVWSLDVASFSSTTIFQVQNLPFDIHRVIPLESPLNGSLLVGCNELIHVDSGGNARRIAVNSFVSDSTRLVKDFVDLSHKELMLEDCVLSSIPKKSMVLMILKNGDLHAIHFDIEGKTIKGLSIDKIDRSWCKDIEMENPGSIVVLSDNLFFFSGKSSDSFLIEIRFSETHKVDKLNASLPSGKSLKPSNFAVEDEDEDDDDDDDDEGLYDDDKIQKLASRDVRIFFVKHDILTCNGPISSFTLGKYHPEKFVANLPNPSHKEVSIIAASGVGKSSCLNVMTPTVQPIIRSSLRFSQIHRLWILSNKYLVTSDDSNRKSEIFNINKNYARIPSKHFLNTDLTIAMHELGNGGFFLQVTPRQVFLFDHKLNLVVGLDDELTEFGDASIINSVFNDDFLMMFFSTGEVVIYSVNTCEKVFKKFNLPKLLSDTIITTGYITNSRLLDIVQKDISVLIHKGQKRKRGAERLFENASATAGQKLKTFVLVTGDNRIIVFHHFHNEKCFQLNSVNKFTNRLSLGFFDINGTEPDPFIKQVILNDLGDEFLRDEYLTILTVGGEIYTYKMYFDGENHSFTKEVNTRITGAPYNAYPYGTSLERRLIYFPDVSGLTCLMVTGVIPYLITRSRHSLIRIHKFSRVPIISFVPYSDARIKNGLIFLDTKKNARIAELSREFNYGTNWPLRRIPIGSTIKGVTYHESSHTFIVSTYKELSYNCLDEEGNPIVGSKSDRPPAQSYKGCIQLISPISWTSIDSFPLDDNEVGLQLKSLPLDIGSEAKRFKQKKEFILIGTGKYRVEDLASNGSYRLLEIIDIIPEPGRPETNHKFKEVTREDTRGAVTALCEMSGRFLIAQGQKVIVRDIKDTTAVSVAFMDLSVYVTEAKSFGNLILFGDTLKGISLAGFDAEPFRIVSLAKEVGGNDINCADFIYHNQDIFIISADRDKVIHVLSYNPDDPASSNGQRLLPKSSFNTNFSATCMKTLPKHEAMPERLKSTSESFQIITSTAEGAMYTVFPVDEAAFKRMYILQQQLMDKEHYHCGLNPRSNRASRFGLDADSTQWPILDCEILRRFAKLNEDRARVLEQKMSLKSAAIDIWGDLINFESVMGNL